MNTRINVLFFMDGIGNAGGIQEMALKWIENFNPQKVRVDILSYDTGKKDNYPERVKKFGCEVYIVPTYTRRTTFFKSLHDTEMFFKENKGKYDIIHAHASAKAFFVLWYAKKYGINVRILHSHSSRTISEKVIQRLAANCLKIPASLLTTDKFACSPEAGKYLFGRFAVKTGRVKIIHNAIDIEKFKYDKEERDEIREKLNISNKFVVGHVGRFMEPKNHDFLIDVFEKIYKKEKNAVLVCVGSGGLEETIKKKCIDLRIDDRVMFLGFRSDVNKIMQAFDLLIMPSLFEGLPVTGVEAQALGVPALFADTITKDAAILPQSSYLSLKQSPEEWADKALEYKTMQKEENPSKYIVQKGYDLKLETKKLEEYYFMSCEKKNA